MKMQVSSNSMSSICAGQYFFRDKALGELFESVSAAKSYPHRRLSYILLRHKRMKAPGQGAGRALSQLAKYPTQCFSRTSRVLSTSRHHSTSTIKSYDVLPPTGMGWQLISKSSVRSAQVRVSRRQISFAQGRRHFSVSRIALHNDLVPPKPGEEYVKSQ